MPYDMCVCFFLTHRVLLSVLKGDAIHKRKKDFERTVWKHTDQSNRLLFTCSGGISPFKEAQHSSGAAAPQLSLP